MSKKHKRDFRKEQQFYEWLVGRNVEFPYFKDFIDVKMPKT